jgi:hypothetical protein
MANYPRPTAGSKHNANSGYKPGVRRELREERQLAAKSRQAEYDVLTPSAKLARLNADKFVAAKQRARLTNALAGSKS